MAVILSLASERGSVPIDWRLYLPEVWAKDRRRSKKSGVPTGVKFLTKPQIALEQNPSGQSNRGCHGHCAGGCRVWQRNGVA